MFRVFEATTADLVWQKVADQFRSGQFQRSDGTRGGDTNEILHTALTISNPRQRWVCSRRPALNVAFALAEIVWILRGRNDSAFLNYFNRELPKYAGNRETYHGAYGLRLRSAFGFDQLERAYNVLKANPKSRQTVLQIWDPGIDFPDNEGRPVSCDIPCNISALLKVRQGKLEWLQIMRSNDVFRGLPYNLVQFTTLHEIMGGWLGLDLGEYHHLSDSLHVYDDSVTNISQSIPTLVAENEDNLGIPKSESDAAFKELECVVEKAIASTTTADELVEMPQNLPIPAAHQNITRVICAESVRRRGRRDLAEKILANCTNEVFSQLYEAWLSRVGGVPR